MSLSLAPRLSSTPSVNMALTVDEDDEIRIRSAKRKARDEPIVADLSLAPAVIGPSAIGPAAPSDTVVALTTAATALTTAATALTTAATASVGATTSAAIVASPVAVAPASSSAVVTAPTGAAASTGAGSSSSGSGGRVAHNMDIVPIFRAIAKDEPSISHIGTLSFQVVSMRRGAETKSAQDEMEAAEVIDIIHHMSNLKRDLVTIGRELHYNSKALERLKEDSSIHLDANIRKEQVLGFYRDKFQIGAHSYYMVRLVGERFIVDTFAHAADIEERFGYTMGQAILTDQELSYSSVFQGGRQILNHELIDLNGEPLATTWSLPIVPPQVTAKPIITSSAASATASSLPLNTRVQADILADIELSHDVATLKSLT